MASCEAITRAGEPCRSGALAGSDRCIAHSPPEVKARYRFGGAQDGSGRPRTPRIGELVAAAAVEHADELIAALRAGLNDPRQRVQAAGTWLRIAHREAELVQREQRADEVAGMSREQMLGMAARVLAKLQVAGRLDLVFGASAASIPLAALEGTATEAELALPDERSGASMALPRPGDPALQAG